MLSRFQASYQRVEQSHNTDRAMGKKIYKLVRCGSREAALSRAHDLAGLGWRIVFSCVFRLGETFNEREGPVERLDKIQDLAENARDDRVIRVFY